MKKTLTCIICPVGCEINIENKEGEHCVFGNACPRGRAYAIEELTAPKRTLTSTVKTKDGRMVSVKTQNPIPKEKLFDAMKIINSLEIDLPITIGTVIIEDVYGSPLVATENKK